MTATGSFCLTPSESKRLIAKAVAQLPEVQHALREGKLIISTGSTSAFVVEEILGQKITKEKYITGYISNGTFNATDKSYRMAPYAFIKGKPTDISVKDLLKDFGPDDVLIKSANAVDPQWNAGILNWDEFGGTIGEAFRVIQPRGAHLIIPVGLEKLVPSVIEASRKCGILRTKYVIGSKPIGFFPIVSGKVITEIQAIKLLTGVDAFHVASGGIGGSEGSVVLVIEGDDSAVSKAIDFIRTIKGEPPISKPAG